MGCGEGDQKHTVAWHAMMRCCTLAKSITSMDHITCHKYTSSIFLYPNMRRLHVDGLVVSSHSSLLESCQGKDGVNKCAGTSTVALRTFGQGRVGETRSCNVFRRSLVFNGETCRGDHFTGVGTDDMATKDLVGILFNNLPRRITALAPKIQTTNANPTHEFHQTLGILVGLCTRVGRERELADLVRDTGVLQLLLILSDPCDFRVRVHDRGDSIVVDVSVARLDDFDGGDTFLFSLVRQHGTESGVTDTHDSLDARVELVVDDDTASVVELDTDLFQSEVLGDGSSTDGYQDDVGFELQQAM